jgi:hypothetical protein
MIHGYDMDALVAWDILFHSVLNVPQIISLLFIAPNAKNAFNSATRDGQRGGVEGV